MYQINEEIHQDVGWIGGAGKRIVESDERTEETGLDSTGWEDNNIRICVESLY